MKNYIYCFSILLSVLLVACTTTKELKESKSPNENFLDAISLFEQSRTGKNFKKLATTLDEANEQSIEKIKGLKRVKDDSRWVGIIDEVENILDRETMISELDLADEKLESLDLFDIEGLNRITSLIAGQACAYHYPLGVKSLLDAEKSKDREKAKEAYKHLDIVFKYNTHYKNTDQLLSKAIGLASQNILVTLDKSVFEKVPSEYLFAFKALDVGDDEWVTYHGSKQQNVNYDLAVKLDLSHFRIYPLNETVRTVRLRNTSTNLTANASTEAGAEQLNKVLNTLGETKTAYLGTKDALIEGKLIITKPETNELLTERNISFKAVYEKFTSSTSALPTFGLTGYPKQEFENLSIDQKMAVELIEKTKSEMIKIINRNL